ncbi:DUF6493 family protein [Luedemannella helvata]|uniref:DUF6493 family protein n=1 Tax=Luedemannella helvata TaxID=349315 RepID=A0ABN2KXA5_9ACTN
MSAEFAAEVLRHVGKGDTDGVVLALRAATPQQRQAVAAVVKKQLTGVDQWAAWQRRHEMRALMVAGAGCLPTAIQVAGWLNRPAFGMVDMDPAVLVAVLTDRGVPWLPDLAWRLADGLTERSRTPQRWRLAADLVTVSGAQPPTGDQFVLGWLESLFTGNGRRRHGVAQALRESPFLDALVPRLFEVDGAGAIMAAGSGTSAPAQQPDADHGVLAFASLAGDGRLDRATLLDGCLGRFLKGDRPAALTAFVTLHDALAPTLDELAERHEDYARLLPVAPPVVATRALKALRALDDAGRLDVEVIAQAGRDVLFRPQRGLVRTQLSWMDRAAKRHPEAVGDLLGSVATAFGHPSLDLQERALTIVARHVGGCDADARAALADAATMLGADLAGRAAGLLRTPLMAEPVDLPAVVALAPRPMPAPIASPAELAAEATVVLGGGDLVAWERVLAGCVSLAGDRAALHDVLAPVLDRTVPYANAADLHNGVLDQLLGMTLRAVIRKPPLGLWQQTIETISQLATLDVTRRKPWRGLPAPHAMLLQRVAEVGHRVRRQPVPFLVATPTTATGHLDPAVLVDRVASAERDGWQPWPVDFAQALLRLPREADPEVVARAAGLTSPAGRRLAARLAAGAPAYPRVLRATRDWAPPWSSSAHVTGLPIVRLVPPEPSDDPIADALFRDAPIRRGWPVWLAGQALWPGVLPSHREVVAAHLLPDLAVGPEYGAGDPVTVLPALAEGTGPCGPAVATALAYGLGAARESGRVAGVDAALTLAVTGDLDGFAVGDALAALLAADATKVNRITASLTDLANAGQPAATWAIASRVLAAVLPLPKAPPSTPDLLALASRTAAGRPDLAPLPELAPVAARAGNGRLVTEARRLQRVLSQG